MKTMSCRQGGFTLVEVIVVAVIVAVLASVAVPIYLQYTQNAKVNQANNIAGSVASFCGACGSDASNCQVSVKPGLEVGGEAVCPGNGTAILLPQGYHVTIQGVIGTGTVAAVRMDDATLTSKVYDF